MRQPGGRWWLDGAMPVDPHRRAVLPIPDVRPSGLVTYDAKDPATAFPPIEPLRPPVGAPNVLIVLLDVVREVVHGDTVVLNILHDELLRLGEFGRGEGVGAANDRDDVDAGSETLHQLDIEFAEASIEALVL